jgi:hypothetical protein
VALVIGAFAAAAVGAAIAPSTLDETMVLHVGSYPELFAAALTATLVGGVLVGTCRRTVSTSIATGLRKGSADSPAG